MIDFEKRRPKLRLDMKKTRISNAHDFFYGQKKFPLQEQVQGGTVYNICIYNVCFAVQIWLCCEID